MILPPRLGHRSPGALVALAADYRDHRAHRAQVLHSHLVPRDRQAGELGALFLIPLVAVAAVACERCQEAYAEARRTIEQAGGIAKCMEVVTT